MSSPAALGTTALRLKRIRYEEFQKPRSGWIFVKEINFLHPSMVCLKLRGCIRELHGNSLYSVISYLVNILFEKESKDTKLVSNNREGIINIYLLSGL